MDSPYGQVISFSAADAPNYSVMRLKMMAAGRALAEARERRIWKAILGDYDADRAMSTLPEERLQEQEAARRTRGKMSQEEWKYWTDVFRQSIEHVRRSRPFTRVQGRGV